MEGKYLEDKLKQWIEVNGKLPRKDDMKVREGYPSCYQFFKALKVKRWSEVLKHYGYSSTFQAWSNKEVRILINEWEVCSDIELAKKLNRSVNAVNAMRISYGLRRQSTKQVWQQWEIDYLLKNFNETDREEIEEKLSHRKWETIRAYATKQLKLKRKNRLYKYQLDDGKRRCDTCYGEFPETNDFFYKDGKSYRTKCINCYNRYQEEVARSKGVFTRKLKQEYFQAGLSRCSKCTEWKSLKHFRVSNNDIRSIRRYCFDCDKKYLWEYNLKKRYGDNFAELYLLEHKELIDNQGVVWDSLDEVYISNKLLEKGYRVRKGLHYNKVFEFDKSRRRLDFFIEKDGVSYHIEYFGCWGKKNFRPKYKKGAKRKIKLLYKYKDEFNFIILFPDDIKKNKLDCIFDSL